MGTRTPQNFPRDYPRETSPEQRDLDLVLIKRANPFPVSTTVLIQEAAYYSSHNNYKNVSHNYIRFIGFSQDHCSLLLTVWFQYTVVNSSRIPYPPLTGSPLYKRPSSLLIKHWSFINNFLGNKVFLLVAVLQGFLQRCGE